MTQSSSGSPSAEVLDAALESSLAALDHLGEGEPDGLGVDHVGIENVRADGSTDRLIERVTADGEWQRLQRPDYEAVEIAARVISVKEAAAKALGTAFTDEFAREELVIPRLAERPFRVRCDSHGDRRIYASSALRTGIALAAAATFPND